MTQENKISFLNIIPIPLFLLYKLLTDDHEVGEIYYSFSFRTRKEFKIVLNLILFPIVVDILPVETPHTITNIAINSPLVCFAVVGHGRFYQVFHI